MNVYGEELPTCYFHPRQIVVGICSLCLRERLLTLAAKQGHGHQHQAKDTHKSLQVLKGKLTIYLPRFFILSSILRFRHQRPNDTTLNEGSSFTSQDSFMSIRFDDDQHEPQGHEISSMKASSKLFDSTAGHQAMPRQHKEGGNNVVVYAKQAGIPRWRKRIGRLFKLARWKMAAG